MSPAAERGRLLLSQGRPELALPELRQALAVAPDDGRLHFLHALCLHRLDREAEALDAVAQALRTEPDSAPCHWLRGACLTELERWEEARAAFEEARRLDPDDADVWAGIAALHAAQRQWEPALAAAEGGLRLDAEHTDCSNLRAFALAQLGRSAEARTQAEAELARDPDNGWTHAQRGWALLNAGRSREAADSFREALRLEPGLEFARRGLIEALRARNPLYALFLRYFLWMGRLGKHAWMVILGLFLAQRLLRSLAEANPDIAWLFWTGYWLLFAFAAMTWIVQPLFNFALWLHPLGRIALNRGEKLQSLVLAGALLVPIALAAGTLAGAFNGSWLPALICAMFILPITFAAEPALIRGWRIAVLAIIAILIGMAVQFAMLNAAAQRADAEALATAKAHGIADVDELAGRAVMQAARDLGRRKAAPAAPATSSSAASASATSASAAQAATPDDGLPAAVQRSVQASFQARNRARKALDRFLLAWLLGSIACVFISTRKRS